MILYRGESVPRLTCCVVLVAVQRHEWFLQPEPESIPFKGEWEGKLQDKLQRMVDRFPPRFRVFLLTQRMIDLPG